MTKPIISESYKLTPATYFKIAAGAIFPKLLCIGIVFMLTSLTIGLIFDIRYILIALIIAFIVMPMIISHIYFSKLLTTDAQFALKTKHIIINPEEDISEIFDYTEDDTALISPRKWQWSSIKSKKIIGKNLVISFHKSEYALIIPLKSINYNHNINSIIDTIE